MEQTFASTVLLPKSIVTTHKLTFEKSQMGVFWLLLAFRLRIAFMFYFSCVYVCVYENVPLFANGCCFFCHSLYLCIITKRPKYQIYGYETSAHLCIVIVLFRMVMTRCFPTWTFWSLLWGHTHFQHRFFFWVTLIFSPIRSSSVNNGTTLLRHYWYEQCLVSFTLSFECTVEFWNCVTHKQTHISEFVGKYTKSKSRTCIHDT